MRGNIICLARFTFSPAFDIIESVDATLLGISKRYRSCGSAYMHSTNSTSRKIEGQDQPPTRRRHGVILRIICLFNFMLLCACGSTKEPDSNRPVLASDTMTISQVYAGDSISFMVETDNAKLLPADNNGKPREVEILFEDAIKERLDDPWIDSTQVLVSLKKRGKFVVLEIPTTTDFQPGIWHVKEIKTQGKDSQTFVEGKDFSGFPVRLTNALKPSSVAKAPLVFVSVEAQKNETGR
jgi:hypothetical protein